MGAGESPAVARRRLRIEIRRAREAAGFTQGQVAEALEWSLSKVNRIESGDVTISNTDLRALLGLFGVTDQVKIDRMVTDSRASRQRGWWDESRYKEHLTPATLQLIQFESEATAVRTFQTLLVPGILQIREYAEAVLRSRTPIELSDDSRAVRVEVRLRRRAQVIDRAEPATYLVILDESVLLREFGGPQVALTQLQELLDLIDKSKITVRIVPLSDPTVMAIAGAFTIFDIGPDQNALLYRENLGADEILQTPSIVERFQISFERMWRASYPEDVARRMIEARVLTMLTALNRVPGG